MFSYVFICFFICFHMFSYYCFLWFLGIRYSDIFWSCAWVLTIWYSAASQILFTRCLFGASDIHKAFRHLQTLQALWVWRYMQCPQLFFQRICGIYKLSTMVHALVTVFGCQNSWSLLSYVPAVGKDEISAAMSFTIWYMFHRVTKDAKGLKFLHRDGSKARTSSHQVPCKHVALKNWCQNVEFATSPTNFGVFGQAADCCWRQDSHSGQVMTIGQTHTHTETLPNCMHVCCHRRCLRQFKKSDEHVRGKSLFWEIWFCHGRWKLQLRWGSLWPSIFLGVMWCMLRVRDGCSLLF